MEGLLPLVYKAIKRNKTRRQYECLSSGNALSYNISMTEMFPQTQDPVLQNHQDHKIAHRRYKSVGDFGNRSFQSAQVTTTGVDSPSPNKLVRFRSQRMFSCITGV